MEIPAKKWISKSSSPVPEKIRGVLNNIPYILVKVRGSGVKFRFWTPFDPTFGRETCPIYGKMTQQAQRQGISIGVTTYIFLLSHKKRGWCQKGVLEGVQ